MAGFAAANAAVNQTNNQTQDSFSQFGEARPEAGTPVEPAEHKRRYSFSEKDLQEPSHYQLIPEGDYDFTVYSCQATRSTSKDEPMVRIILAIDYEGNQIWVEDNILTKENMMWKIGRFFASIGLRDSLFANGMGFGEDGTNDPIWQTAVGAQGRFRNKHHTYNGKTKNRVATYIFPGNLAVR